MTAGLLEGVRVVDLTQVLAGPFCTMILADLGADVIKVESANGDPTRSWGPFRPDDERRAFGGYFASINRNKRSLVVDLKQPAGRDVLLDVLAGAHVVVENFRAGVMDRLGLSYEELSARFPPLVYATLRGFGDPRSGRSPYVDRPAYDIIAQAMGGLTGITGFPGGVPVKTGPGVGDIYPGTLAAVGIVAAIRQAERTGTGCFVDVALYDGVLALCERIVYQWSCSGVSPGPAGNGHSLLCPYGLFPTADGWVALAAPTDRHWRRLADLIGRPELGERLDLATNVGRVAHEDEVHDAVATWTASATTADVLAALADVVPCGPVNLAEDIVADPHVAVREMVVEVPHPGSGPIAIAGRPIKVAGEAAAPMRRAPLLGEDTVEILESCGYDRVAIDALDASSVVRCGGDASLSGSRTLAG
jgi:crotonobetainyl-CoA:carnitine CoA-transferase CaiB-like acyl-CoA transferase